MSELQIIESARQRAANRRRWSRGLRGLWYGLLIGALMSLLLLTIYHVRELPLWMLLAAALLPVPGMLIGLIIGGWRKPAIAEVARWVDGRQHLQERLSTALEVAANEAPGHWRDLIVTDAAAHAKAIDPRRMVQFSLPRVTR